MIQYREMEISDYQGVINLWTASDGMTLRDADSQENIDMYLQRNQGLSFVAIDNSQIIGAVLVGTDGRRGYLQHLSVSSAYQSRGIGQKLVDHVISASKIILGYLRLICLFTMQTKEPSIFIKKWAGFPETKYVCFPITHRQTLTYNSVIM